MEYVSRPITSTMEWEVSPAWSPEGEFIAYARRESGHLEVVVQPVAGGEAVVRAGGPGDEFSPHWSPDGKYLAYISSSEPGSHVFLAPPFGGSPRRLIDTNVPAINDSIRDIQQSTESLKNLLNKAETGDNLAAALLADEELANQISDIAYNLSVTSSNLNERGLWGIMWKKKKPKPEPETNTFEPLRSPGDPFR